MVRKGVQVVGVQVVGAQVGVWLNVSGVREAVVALSAVV